MQNILKYILFLFLISSCKKKEINPYDISPRAELDVVNQPKRGNIKDNLFELTKEITLPPFVDNIYAMESSWGTLYFADNRNIYVLNNGKVVKYYTPGKGRGPKEVTSVYRFDIVKDTLMAITAYPASRVLIKNILADTTYIITTSYNGEILIDKSKNIILEKSWAQSNKMFLKLNLQGDTLAQFGHLFTNQYRTLDALNMWVDNDNKANIFAIGFINAGFYAGFNNGDKMLFLSESMMFPRYIPKIINTDRMTYTDTEGKLVTGSITLYKDEFHVVSGAIGNEKGEPIGSVIDVMDSETGKYKYSYKLNRYVNFLEMINDSTIAGITNNFKLAIWKKDE